MIYMFAIIDILNIITQSNLQISGIAVLTIGN